MHFRTTRGVSEIHMSEVYFGLGDGTGLKLGRMKENSMSACLSGCPCMRFE